MESVTISKDEYEFFIGIKEKFENFLSKAQIKSWKKFNPKKYYGVAKSSNYEVNRYLKNIRDEWK